MEKSEKRIRFEKVASKRVQKIMDSLVLLQNCANRNNYEFYEHDVELMFDEIGKALKETKNAYSNALNNKKKSGFRFI